MNPADGPTQRGPVGNEHPRAGHRHGTAACPLLLGPVGLEVLAWSPGLRAEELLEVPDPRRAPRRGGHPREPASRAATDEPEDDTGPSVGRRIVEGSVFWSVQGHCGAVQFVFLPV